MIKRTQNIDGKDLTRLNQAVFKCYHLRSFEWKAIELNSDRCDHTSNLYSGCLKNLKSKLQLQFMPSFGLNGWKPINLMNCLKKELWKMKTSINIFGIIRESQIWKISTLLSAIQESGNLFHLKSGIISRRSSSGMEKDLHMKAWKKMSQKFNKLETVKIKAIK